MTIRKETMILSRELPGVFNQELGRQFRRSNCTREIINALWKRKKRIEPIFRGKRYPVFHLQILPTIITRQDFVVQFEYRDEIDKMDRTHPRPFPARPRGRHVSNFLLSIQTSRIINSGGKRIDPRRRKHYRFIAERERLAGVVDKSIVAREADASFVCKHRRR